MPTIISIILGILGNLGNIISIVKNIINLIEGLPMQASRDKAYADLSSAYRTFKETGDNSQLNALHDALAKK